MPAAKTLVAVLAAVLAAVLPGLTGIDTDHQFGLVQLVNVVVLAAGAVQVYNAPNISGWPIAKTIAAAVAAGGVVVISAVSDSVIDPAEWVQIALAVLGAIGVYAIPNSGGRPAAAAA